MSKGGKQLRSGEGTVVPFLVEAGVYGCLITAYFFLVLHFLGDTLNSLYQHHRTLYAVVALGLIVGQGFLLESLTRLLLRFFQRRINGN